MRKIARLLLVFVMSVIVIISLQTEVTTSLPSDVTVIENKTLVFGNTQNIAEYRWNLKELNSEMTNDWSLFRFLVIELKASSPQRLQIQLHTPQGVSPLYLHPFQKAWIRAAIPLEIFSTSPNSGDSLPSLFNNQRAGYFMFHWGPYLPLNQVESIGISLPKPIGQSTVEIRAIRLTRQSSSDAVLEKEPLVDEMGQWIREQWPGKAQTVQELQEAWRVEEKQLQPGNFYCQYGGYCSTSAKATGFFHVELIDGKWWLVDPEGHLFFSTGVNAITPLETTRLQGRTQIWSALPPEDLLPATSGDSNAQTSFYIWNLSRRFGKAWPKAWVDLTVRRMQAWGLNTVGNWSDTEITDAQRIPYTLPLYGWETEQMYLGLPDVYSQEFERNSDIAAQQCVSRKDDRFLVGYFIGNEPSWAGREDQVAEMILNGPETATRRELQNYLAQEDTPERRKAFLYKAFDKYLVVVNGAIREYDPNHLILGIRFGGLPPDDVVKASRVFDIMSVNLYDYRPDKDTLEKLHRLSGRPLLLGEFHFGVPGRGMSAGLKQVRDQKERGVGYRYYVENAAAMPAVVGAHWFQWVDEPNTGRGDGENYNIGVVDITDRPYPELIEAMQATHRELYQVHSGKQAPVAQQPLVD